MQECLHNCVINFDKTDSAQICFLGDAIVEDNDDGEMYDDVDEIKNQILGGQEDEQSKQEANGNNNVVDYIAINIKNLNQKCWTLHTQRSVCVFCWQGEFVEQSRAS